MSQNTNEGFDNHGEFVLRQHKQFNDIALTLDAKKNTGVLGNTANKLLNTFEFPNNTPLNSKRDGLWATIDKCEAVKTSDCSIFDDPEFKNNCGVCLDIGKNSDSVPATGGMVLLPEDKILAEESASSNYLPDYKPTVGSCPAGKMVSTKAQCLKLQRQILCRKNSSYSLEGCSQCYSDTTYSVIDPKTSPGVITGHGEVLIVGRGKLTIQETGFPNKSGITLHSTSPYKLNIKGKESDRIKFILEPAPASGDEDPDVPYMSGLLNGPTYSGLFSSDLRRIILVDETTGRKPRTYGKDTIDGITVTKMAPGFEKDKANIIAIIPFTFVETSMEESSNCKDAPFITTRAAAEFLESDPCYKKGSGPGKFSLECLQGIWDDNGCNASGKGYPGNAAGAAALMTAKDGSFLSLNDIANLIYSKALITSTGIDETGKTQAMKDWSDASVFCTGREITSPCDTPSKNTGPLSPECIIHLWNNQSSKKTWQGTDDPIGPTYSLPDAVSLFSQGPVDRSCQATGTLSPVDPAGKKKRDIIRYWQGQGGVNNVKTVMANLHRAANAQRVADDQLAPYFKQCYGDIQFASRPATVFKVPNNRLPPIFNITRNTVLVQSLAMTQDYKLQFVIKPKTIQNQFTNILLFTKFANGDDWNAFGCRTPAIWFFPNELKLHVRIGGLSDYNWGMDVVGCELNKESAFSLECRGTSVKITLDGKTFSATHPDIRYSGNVTVYGSSKQHPAAVADIKDVGLQLFGNSIKVETGPWRVTVGNNGTHEKSVPLPPGVSSTARNIKIISQGHSDDFVSRIEGNNLIVRRVDSYSGWGASYVAEISEGDQPHFGDVKTVMLIGKGTWLNFSQIVVLDEKGNNVSRGKPTAGSGKLAPNTGTEKAVDGNERPRGHPDEYHSSGDSNRGAYFKVTLDNPTKVSSVVIYNRADCCQDRMKQFSLLLINSSGDILYQRGGLTEAAVQVVKPALQANQFSRGASIRDVPMCYSIKYGDLYNAFDNGFAPGTNVGALQSHWDNHGRNEGRKGVC